MLLHCTSQSQNMMRSSKQKWKVVKSFMLFFLPSKWCSSECAICFVCEWRKLEAIKPQSAYCIFSFSHFGIYTVNISWCIRTWHIPLNSHRYRHTDWVKAHTWMYLFFQSSMNEFLLLLNFLKVLSFVDQFAHLIISIKYLSGWKLKAKF